MKREQKDLDDTKKDQQYQFQQKIRQEWSPQKPNKEFVQQDDWNQRFNVPIVSGKKHKALTLNLYSIQRQNSYKNYRFTPLRNIMIQWSNQKQKNTSNNTPILRSTPSHQKIKNQNKNQAQIIAQQKLKNDLLRATLYQKLRAKQQLVKKNQILKSKLKQLNHLNQQLYVDVEKVQDQLASDIFQVKELVKQQQKLIFTKSKQLFLCQRRIADYHIQFTQKQNMLNNIQKSIREQSIIETYLIQKSNTREIQLAQKDYQLRISNLKVKQFRLQTAVLKMQINPLMRVGFSSVSTDEDHKKKLLQRDPTVWQKRNKNLINDEIKYYIIIQLYRSWRQILNRFSSNFIGFQQIFCEKYSQQKIEDLYNYIIQEESSEFKPSKLKHYLVFYSPHEESYINFCNVIMSLQGLNNQILSIDNVAINESNPENIKLVYISYSFRGEKRQKIFQFVRLYELSKESVSNYIPKLHDKTALFKIEVPLAFGSVIQLSKAEEAYKCLQRKT